MRHDAAEKGKEHAVEYTVLGEDQIPDEIRKVVDVKKQEEFQMTYQEEDMLYLLQGYGIQSSGGYSIRVEKVSENDTELHVKTKLIGPEEKWGDGGDILPVSRDQGGKPP